LIAQVHFNIWLEYKPINVCFSPQKTVKSAAPLARSKANPTIVMQLYQDYQNYQKQAGKMLIKSFFNVKMCFQQT
jgi:hypothetical protein